MSERQCSNEDSFDLLQHYGHESDLNNSGSMVKRRTAKLNAKLVKQADAALAASRWRSNLCPASEKAHSLLDMDCDLRAIQRRLEAAINELNSVSVS